MISLLTTLVVLLTIVALVKIAQLHYYTGQINDTDYVEEVLLDELNPEPIPSVKEMLAHEVAAPIEGGDYHGHTNYIVVYIILMVLFGVSLLGDLIENKLAMILLIFGTAFVKAFLVITKFMHLKYEPKLIVIFVFAVAFCLGAFFWFIYPDIVMETLDLAKL